MLKLLNTKILLAILAAVLALGAYAAREHELHQRAAAAAAQAAALLQQQHDAAEAARKHDEELRTFIEKQHRTHDMSPARGSKTWTTYIP